MKAIEIGQSISVGNGKLTLIAGPCAIENEEMCMEVCHKMQEICDKLDIQYIFKASFDKANRSSIHSERGVGIERGLEILAKIRDTFSVPVITDVHEVWQCERVGKVVDVIQIPAFLARQTDLIVAAAKTGKAISVKKGQFMAPWDMKQVISKCLECGNERIILTERGTSFGYNNLVVDMTGMIEMLSYGYPVVFDATHSVQKPGGGGSITTGNREYVPHLINAAIAVGVNCIFAEVHPDPDNAVSDATNQLRLDNMEEILSKAIQLHKVINNQI